MSQPGEWTPNQILLDPREEPMTPEEWDKIEKIADKRLIDQLSEKEKHLHGCRARTMGRAFAIAHLRARKAAQDEES